MADEINAETCVSDGHISGKTTIEGIISVIEQKRRSHKRKLLSAENTGWEGRKKAVQKVYDNWYRDLCKFADNNTNIEFVCSFIDTGDNNEAGFNGIIVELTQLLNAVSLELRQLKQYGRFDFDESKPDYFDISDVLLTYQDRNIGNTIFNISETKHDSSLIAGDKKGFDKALYEIFRFISFHKLVDTKKTKYWHDVEIYSRIVSFRKEEKTKPSNLYSIKPGDYLCLSIAFRKPLIDETHHNKLFSPFYSTDVMGCGQGIGLALTYDYAKKWGGYIDFASIREKTIKFPNMFVLYLPIQKSAEKERSKT